MNINWQMVVLGCLRLLVIRSIGLGLDDPSRARPPLATREDLPSLWRDKLCGQLNSFGGKGKWTTPCNSLRQRLQLTM